MANHKTLAEIGTQFNEVTLLLEGGITNRAVIVDDLYDVQNGLRGLLEDRVEHISGAAAIHVQEIIDQLNVEIAHVRTVGSDPLAPKFINDIHRDIIDIVQGDPVLAADAGHGFAAVPSLLVPAAPFADNAAQTAFLAQFTLDSNSLGQRAVDLLTNNHNHHHGQDPAVATLVHDIQMFINTADSFTHAQGGLFDARFDNELASDGVLGTAARALIHSLEHGNLTEASSAATILSQNATDVNSNNLALGATPTAHPSGIPSHFDSFGQVGTVFNDATVKLIGGIYDNGGTNNHAGIVADLTATHDGLVQVSSEHPELFNTAALGHLVAMEKLINTEIGAINGVLSNPQAAQLIHDDHLAVIAIVQSDPTLKALAAGDNGFQPLPPAPGHHDEMVAQYVDVHQHHTQIASDWLPH
jgi:hypothetical protein